jgi:hypothetical protein
VALVVAILAGGALLFAPLSRPRPGQAATPDAVAPGAVPLAQVWPDAKPSSYPAPLSDGTQFSPVLHIDQDTVVGTAPTRDGKAVRVLLRTPRRVVEVRRLARDVIPQFAGFTTSGDTLVWAETTHPDSLADDSTRLWRFNWRRPGRAALITADTGQAVFFQTQYDLVVADGMVHWAAAELVANMPVTQIRTVALTGGKVAVRRERGTYVLSAWPWMVTPFSGRAEPARLINLATGKKITVSQTPGELPRCSPAWCRIGITGETGLVRTDLKRPDGTQRRRMAGGDATPVLNDVALLNRFEALLASGGAADGSAAGPVVGGDRLELYDIETRRTVVLATGLFTVLGHGGLLWWSTGTEDSLTWHALDLARLT